MNEVDLRRLLTYLLAFVSSILSLIVLVWAWGPFDLNRSPLDPQALRKLLRCMPEQGLCIQEDCGCVADLSTVALTYTSGWVIAVRNFRLEMWGLWEPSYPVWIPGAASYRRQVSPPWRVVKAGIKYGISLWPLVLCAIGTLGLRLAIVPLRKLFPGKEDSSSVCANCGYLLRGLELPGCPECGFLRGTDEKGVNCKRVYRTSLFNPTPLFPCNRHVLLQVECCILAWAVLWLFWALDVFTMEGGWLNVYSGALTIPRSSDVLPIPIALFLHVVPPACLALVFWNSGITWRGRLLAIVVLLASATLFVDALLAATRSGRMLLSPSAGFFRMLVAYLPSMGFYVVLGSICSRVPSKLPMLMYFVSCLYGVGMLLSIPQLTNMASWVGPEVVFLALLAAPLFSICGTIAAFWQIRRVVKAQGALRESL